MIQIETALAAFANFMWGPPMVVLLVGGGFYFMLHSRMQHFRYIAHSMELLRGRYTEQSGDAAGDITHYRALATALAV